MSDWTVSVGVDAAKSLAAIKIEDLSIVYASRASDTATVACNPSVAWTYGTLIGIYFGASRVFYGRVLRSTLNREGAQTVRVYTVAGPWNWLERVTFRQTWAVLEGDELGSAVSSRVVLNQTALNTSLSADGQLQEIIDYAADRGAPIAFGTSGLGLTLPFDEDRDLTCAQALERVLRYTPDMASWIDYTQTVPTIHFGEGAALPAVRIQSDSVTYRDDLVAPGLTIEIERVGSANGTQYRTLEYQTAGTTAGVDALFVTLPLAGKDYSSVRRTVAAVTEAVGDYTGAAWWIAKHPRLEGISAADVTMVSADRGLLAAEFPRISSTPLPDLTAAGCKARLETFSCVCDIIKRDGAEIVSIEYAVTLEMDFITTDAVTKTYSWRDAVSITAAETAPAGLAAALLAHWSVRYAEGFLSIPLADAFPAPGMTVLDSPVQSVTVSSRSADASVEFGPPEHLSPQDFAARLGGFRNRRASIRFASRETAEPAETDESDENSVGPVSSSEWSPGQYGQLNLVTSGKTISLDPSALDADGKVELKDLTYTPAGGASTVVKALMSADVTIAPSGSGIPEGCSQLDATIYCLQFKITAKLNYKVVESVTTYYGLSDWGIADYTSAEKRLLLQGTEPSTGIFNLAFDMGYHKQPAS